MIRLHKFVWGRVTALRGVLGEFGSVGSLGKRYVVGGKGRPLEEAVSVASVSL